MTGRVRIDHLMVGADQPLRELLISYREIGFVVSGFELTMRHEPGLRTGFLYFSPDGTRDYIEFLTVEDRGLFEAAQAKGEHEQTDKPCVQGVGVRVTDARAVHGALTVQGAAVSAVWSKRPEDAAPDSPDHWSFIELEEPASGLGFFYVEYLNMPAQREPEVLMGENGIYALGGLLYDGDDTAVVARALRRDFPNKLVQLKGRKLTLGCHEIVVRPLEAFSRAARGATILKNPYLRVYGALLYTESLAKTAAALKGKWKTHYVGLEEILLLPTEHEGLAAVVREKKVERWKRDRLAGAKWLF